MDEPTRIEVLGPLRVTREGRELPVPGPTLRALLAALTVAGDRPWSADRLVDVLWGDDPPPTAHRTLQSHVSRLRSLLGQDAVAATPGGYALTLPPGSIDARSFELGVAEAAGMEDPHRALGRLEEALALWKGDAYAGLADRDHIRPEVVRLEEMRLAAAERWLELRAATGDAAGAIAELEAYVAANPLRERGWLLLARALAMTGRHAEAMRALDRLRQALAEVGLEPSPAVRQVEDEVLRPPPSPLAAPAPLPRWPTSFVGRDQELDDLTALVDAAPIVTLVGPPGVGKSRLALELAHRVGPAMTDGAVLVSLAPLEDGPAVRAAVAHHIGGPVAPDVDGVVAALRPLHALLVLDNCDEVLEDVAVLVEQVSRECPRMRIVVTSRESLDVDGEHVRHVTPLPLDGGEGPSAAARLFADRARAASPSFRLDASTASLVERICASLDGVPLAIEMAAAQLRTMPLDLIAAEIPGDLLHASRRTADRRHQSLGETVAWTYRLLGPEGRLLFDTVSCFRGGFDAEAAAAVAGTPPEETQRRLGDLVDRSLLRFDPATGRYGMLEVLRQIGARWLRQRNLEEQAWAAHGRWFVERAETAAMRMYGPTEAGAIEEIDRDHDNLRMAHRHALRHRDADALVRLHGALYDFAGIPRGAEMMRWALQTVAELPDPGHPQWPVVYASAALAEINRGDPEAAGRLIAAGRTLAANDRLAERYLDEMAADVALTMGRLDEAVAASSTAVALAVESGDDLGSGLSLAVLALAHSYGGDHAAAAEPAQRLRSLADRSAAPTLRAWSEYVDGETILDRDPPAAIAHLERAVAVAASIRSDFVQSVAEVSLASLQARHGDPAEAAAGFTTVINRWRRLADWGHQWTTLRNLVMLLSRAGADEEAAVVYGGTLQSPLATYGEEERQLALHTAAVRERLGAAGYEAAERRGRSLTPDALVDYALAVLASLPGNLA